MSDPSGTARDDGFMDDPAGSARDDALARHAGVEERGDWLDPLLVAGRDDYVDDDGFTARVMDALPAPAALPAWRNLKSFRQEARFSTSRAALPRRAMLDVARSAHRLLATVPSR